MSYGYDVGHRGVLSSVSTTTGGMALSTQTMGSNSYPFTYRYSLTGRLTEMSYPSGRTVKYPAETLGRVTGVQNGSTAAAYATIDYAAVNGIPKMTLGNGIIEQTAWKDRLQLTGLTAGKANAASVLALSYYPCPNLAVACTAGNNGNLYAHTTAAPGLSVTQSYTYDSVGRLSKADESGPVRLSEDYKYTDTGGTARGNRWVDTTTRQCLPTMLTLETPIAATWYLPSNRINGWTTSDPGNVESVASMTRAFQYDAENRQTGATINSATATYVYDGLGQRVQKTAGGVVTRYIYDAAGELAAEYTNLAGAASDCGTPACYLTVDRLGSTRLLTDAAGNAVRRYDYLPFGTELLAGTNGRTAALGYANVPDSFSLKFTGQVRDPETGLDYLHARMYSAAQGRFTSPDPANAGADAADPQTWNMYAYANNNPVNFTDPSGEGIWSVLGGIVAGMGTFFGSGGNVAAASGVGTQVAGIGSAIEAVVDGRTPGGLTVGSLIFGAGAPGVELLPSLANLTSCGGPFSICEGINRDSWNEDFTGPVVRDPGRLVSRYGQQISSTAYGERYRTILMRSQSIQTHQPFHIGTFHIGRRYE